MKRTILLSLALLPSIFVSPASAADDTRYFQYSAKDTNHPQGFNPALLPDSVQFALTNDGYVQIFVLTVNPVDPTKFVNLDGIGVLVDSNGDKKSEMGISTLSVKYDGSNKVDVTPTKFVNSQAESFSSCDASTWITSNFNAVAFEFPLSCLEWQSAASITGYSRSGDVFDFTPDGTPFWVKTNYMAGFSCTKAKNGSKITYNKIQYICMQKNNKWQYVDYGPVAAAKAKYLTEKAFYACNLHTKKLGASLTDGGKTLVLDHVYKSFYVSELEFYCVTSLLKMPGSVTAQIGMTRSLDGMRSAKWNKLTAFWNYHPDNGLGITITYN